MKNDDVIDELLALDRVILAREHPRLENALVRAASAGRLVRPLPGVFADPGNAHQLVTKVAAVSRWDPNAVIRGRAAAALSYWPEIDVSTVEVASPDAARTATGLHLPAATDPSRARTAPRALRRHHAPAHRDGAVDPRRTPTPSTWRCGGRRPTSPACSTPSSRPASGAATPTRWRVLLDSRAEPWSKAERLAHRLYRDAGITGWVGNLKIWVPQQWATYYLDIAFERQRLACEVDGREFHDTDDAFETDRERQNIIVLTGWTVLRFTWTMLTEQPDHVVWGDTAGAGDARGQARLSRVGCSATRRGWPREWQLPVTKKSPTPTQRALKYFASGWCTISASVDCSGCSCSSSDSSTPIRSGFSRSTSLARSSRSGQAG